MVDVREEVLELSQRGPRVFATLMRGGTSKCWMFREADLPGDTRTRDRLLARLFGSPEPRQIDGIGGATSTTSKAVVIGAARAGHIEYQVAQLSPGNVKVEWTSNCGNCASALGLFVVEERLVNLGDPITTATILNTRTGLRIDAELDTPAARAPSGGDTLITGTLYGGARVVLSFPADSWSSYGSTLSTGEAIETISVNGMDLRVTMVDAGTPAALVWAEDLIPGVSDLAQVAENSLDTLLKLRPIVAKAMHIGEQGGVALDSIPKIGVVGPSSDPGSDLNVQMLSMRGLHPAISITSTVAVGAASGIEGSTASRAIRVTNHGEDFSRPSLRIGTAAGAVEVGLTRSASGGVVAVTCLRSARRLVDGAIYLPPDGDLDRQFDPPAAAS
ncbi:MAG: PrpF domain-containing protein [Acidimicrobiales bacterium]